MTYIKLDTRFVNPPLLIDFLWQSLSLRKFKMNSGLDFIQPE